MDTVVAQDIFQSKLDSIFIGMEGVTGIADDMVIAGRNKMECDRNFLAFMEKCMSNNLTLNSEKIQFKQSQASFYGHCWSKHGIGPDPKKIQALTHREFPPDKETMRSFLGVINYLNRYSALSAHLAAPSGALTHQATDYNMITKWILMSVESQGNFSNKLDQLRKRVQHKMNSSQDSKVTLVQDFLVTRRISQQIFMNSGHTRKCYPSSQHSLHVETES